MKIIKVQSVKIEDVFKEIEILAKCDSPFIGKNIISVIKNNFKNKS